MYTVRYHQLVVRSDIPYLSKREKGLVKRVIEKKLFPRPEVYGQPLRGTLKRYWKLRVGNWRIVYTISKEEVYVLVIAHRAKVYEVADPRK